MSDITQLTPEQVEEVLRRFFDLAGTRQYIGARYVPLFGRRGESSIAWDNSAPYEPLTIVLYQGTSYTSRTYVPTGVDIEDEYYWARTGDYNAQIEQYRQEVIQLESDWGDWKTNTTNDLNDWKRDTLADIDTEIANVQKCAIYIGNSFTKGVGSTGGNTGIYALTKDYLFDEAEMIFESGAGFYAYDTSHQYTFATMLQDKALTMTEQERNKITHLVVISAIGDDRVVKFSGYSVSNLRTGMLAFDNVRKTYFPNAVSYLYLATCSQYNDAGDCNSATTSLSHQFFTKECCKYNIVYLGWGGYINMHGDSTMFSSDHYHPSDLGYVNLATKFIESWHGLKYATIGHAITLTCVEDNTLSIGVWAQQHEDFLHFELVNPALTFASNGTYTFEASLNSETIGICSLLRQSTANFNALFRYKNSTPQIDLRPCQLKINNIPSTNSSFDEKLTLTLTNVIAGTINMFVSPVIFRAGS